ncbi:CHAT domain-containing protein [Nonomuraea angiospora]|uniref:CHAT domain-containing protein n=1 Tax=Nonomuraea angiospora TaxID=46172 RepID=A0ABR9LVF2_9ACTN|nr:CHAT domain-containing protein [Nonomuraea angiospora]MBE1584292.1 CHAT domain-containing protein [Nonomuraea angiospora]
MPSETGAPLSYQGVRASLSASGRRTVMVEYFTMGDEVALFRVAAELAEPEVVRLPLAQEELRRFVVTTFGHAGGVRELVSMGLEELWYAHDRLIEPLGRWSEPGDLVVLVPHGLLHYLPLHALRVDGGHLIDRNPVCYAPSASVLHAVRERHRTRSERGSAAVFGDPRGDLPDARAEVAAVAARLGATAQVGERVTRQAFAEAVSHADIVHFAGHARFDETDARASGLELAGGEMLTARDIGDMSAWLVTLSGCETGVNTRHPGDELVGLTRAFLLAGAASLVVSRWRVADASTAHLMRRFYEHLSRMDKADALRQAIVDTKTDPRWTSPHHWAPFTLVGAWG